MGKVKPLPKERRHVADYRDELEHEAVAEILSELPDEHQAIYIYSTARTSSTAELSYYLTDRMDLVERLKDALYEAKSRVPVGHSGPAGKGRG